jgi:UDPglucose--hexose-1-phosphate uridylyltransferase
MSTWEERWHPLREEWIIVAAHRRDRPWSGETVGKAAPAPLQYDPGCYLCPGNARVSGRRNPPYERVHVFDNDHPCVGPDAPAVSSSPADTFRRRDARGLARVVCYSPRHDLSLAELPVDDVAHLFGVLQEQMRELRERPEVNHVLMFENKGEVVGVSNPHPHGQIYATNFVFKTIETEARVSARHLRRTGRPLFQDLLAAERADGRRILFENAYAVAFVPFFARYAYEVFVAPKATRPTVAELGETELRDFAEALQHVLVKFDNLWNMPFPYVMPLHQAPVDGGEHRGFHFHVEFHPPLRKPGLLKYLAGPEIGGGNFLSDTAPEQKAAELQALPAVHYKKMQAER